MVRCIDRGFCGVHVNLLNSLRWYDMDKRLRFAFERVEELNPAGRTPGTGHWNSVYYVEWQMVWEPLGDQHVGKGQAAVCLRACMMGKTEYVYG